MTGRLSRRRFLGALGGLVGSTLVGCGRADETADPTARVGEPPGGGARDLIDPVLRPWVADTTWLSNGGADVVAYVSMDERRLYVEYDYRDRASWLLHAHISVSSAHWRIPLPGDAEGVPIIPGDALREFEEFPLTAWTPAATPAMDDIRVVLGRPLTWRVRLDCVPSEAGWYSAGPWTLDASDGSQSGTVREDFAVLGTGSRFGDRACRGEGDTVQVVGWAHLDR